MKRFDLWPKQLEAFNSPATEILYGGAAGPGKSHLLRVASIAWAMMIPGLQIYLFRRHYRDLIQGHMEGPTGYKSLLAEAEAEKKVQIVELEIRFLNGPGNGFEGGSRISLNHCQYEQDILNYKTIEFHVLMVEEATEFSEFMIRFARSRVRMPQDMLPRIPAVLKDRFPRCLYATNPGGIGHAYFKKNFVSSAKANEIWQAPDSDGGMIRQFIPARLTDNPSVNPSEYAKRLIGIGSDQYVRALLNGDWSAPVGAFFTEWEEARHVVPDFQPPSYWSRFRTFDWGTAEPFSVYWWALSDGEQFQATVKVIENGISVFREKTLWFPRGALIAYQEWYGCNPLKPSEGLRMRNEDIARGIRARSMELMAASDGLKERKMQTLTDSYPFPDRGEVDKDGKAGHTIADTFRECGVPLTLGKTSRVTGWSQMRSRLVGIQLDSNNDIRIPTMFFVESCQYAREYIPALQYHPSEAKKEDAQEHGEATHSPDAVRLAAMAQEIIKDKEPPSMADEVKRIAASLEQRMTFDDALKIAKRQKRGQNGKSW